MPRVDATFPALRRRHREEAERALGEVLGELVEDVQARWSAGASTLVAAAWDRRVAEVVLERSRAIAGEVGARVAGEFPDQDRADVDLELMEPYLIEYARVAGVQINDTTRAELAEVEDLEQLEGVLEGLLGWRLSGLALALVTAMVAFGAFEGARAGGAEWKTWRVNSGNPRSSHAALSGQTVRLRDDFSNGMAWPGDPRGGADEVAGCQCSLELT